MVNSSGSGRGLRQERGALPLGSRTVLPVPGAGAAAVPHLGRDRPHQGADPHTTPIPVLSTKDAAADALLAPLL